VRREERDPREEMGQGKREPVRERGRGGVGWAERVWAGFFPYSFPFLFYTQTFKQNYLNSNTN
jgi:hypothetical protein